ncbi:uncharacterized protein BJ212DRAFT_1485076 [Suillus subaureus]|uniref:Uncharacterized protein n=1 Tax=Suillus subaureus TaxID=48587 RepID=A0A9P7E1I4_9AGAM|nr:uncharacterized protein BJ212DRAFT_1485076 [Suillus subaureus]KAG1808427.1 hypothetical protein BJ212DRAFT_1485076 [Suillus subaureus]
MSGAHGSKRKGKAAIPKPARGSGLNPSGLPAADQLNLDAEQPQMVPFNFDPYGQSVGGWQDTQQQLYGNAEGPSFCHMQGQAPTQGQLPYDHTQGSLPYGDGEGSMSYGAGPSLFVHTQGLSYQDGEGTLYGDGEGSVSYRTGPSSFSHAQGSSCRDSQNISGEEGYDFYNYFKDISFDSGPSFPNFPPDHPGQTVPVPQWIEEAPDGGTSITD